MTETWVLCAFNGVTREPEMLPFTRVPVAGEWINHADQWWSVYRVYWTNGKARLDLSFVA